MSSRQLTCATADADLSALLDDELTPERARELREHLESCPACRAELEALEVVRRAVRTGVAGPVPDLVAPTLARIEAEELRFARRGEWRVRATIAATAAAAAAVALIGAWLPGGDEPPQTARASAVARDVRARAASLDTYRAAFSITERGWHPAVGERSFSAEVEFKAPQSFRLTLSDQTDYPAGEWPANDVTLVANPRAWWIREPTSCPPASLPGCGDTSLDISQRALVERQPFDGTIGLPTDIVLPLQTLADDPTFDVAYGGAIGGRRALHVSIDVRQAQPLVNSLQAGGSWRTFYPSDPVDLWIDEATGFPLRFEVRASDSAERRIWARRLGYRDQPGAVLLEVEATDFSEPRSFAPGTFAPPQRGTVAIAGFARTEREGPAWMRPDETFDLKPFIAGRTEAGQRLLSYSQGMEWLKVLGTREMTNGVPEVGSEEVELPGGGWAYYEPASAREGRRVELFAEEGRVLVETNLPRAALLEVAASLDLSTERVAGGRTDGSTVQRVAASDLEDLAFVASPTYLPAGYSMTGAFTSRPTAGIVSVSAFYRSGETEYDGLGVRITQSKGVELLPPSPEASVNLVVSGQRLRWFPLRGEIDWIENGVYRSISAPSLSRDTTLRIFEGLR